MRAGSPRSGPEAAPAPEIRWKGNLDRVMEQAIDEFDLQHLGWRGFDALPWVQRLSQQYPRMAQIATTCSVTREGYLDEVRELFSQADPQDRPGLQSYYIGKLGLEELSCRRSGAAAGLCDKKGAFIQIWELTQKLV